MKTRLVIVVAALATLLSSCDWIDVFDDCPMVQQASGIDIVAFPPLATSLTSAHIKACWDNSCHEYDVPMGQPPPYPCPDSAPCPTSPRDLKQGFVETPNLPATPVKITVSMSGGQPQTVMATPRVVSGTSAKCGDERRSAHIFVAADGTVQATP